MRRRQQRYRPPDAPLTLSSVRIPMVALVQALAVAEYLSFHRAAQALGTSQSSVSARINFCPVIRSGAVAVAVEIIIFETLLSIGWSWERQQTCARDEGLRHYETALAPARAAVTRLTGLCNTAGVRDQENFSP